MSTALKSKVSNLADRVERLEPVSQGLSEFFGRC